jgi:hypothetical protein
VKKEAKPPFPAGEAAYMEGVPTRQRLSAFFLKHTSNTVKTGHFGNADGPSIFAVKRCRADSAL